MRIPEDFTLVYFVASISFLVAVLFELWIRSHRIMQFNRTKALSERMEKAIKYFQQNKRRKKITNDIYQELTGVSDSTATRDLQKLVDLGFLQRRGKTSRAYYIYIKKFGGKN